MLTASLANGLIVPASEVSRSDGPFICPDPTCRRPMVLKQGSIRVHHFSHASADVCTYGAAESEMHMRAKLGIFRDLSAHPDCVNVALERYLGTVRPDVSLRIRGVPVAIEVQQSNIEVELIRHRMAEYTRKGIYVVWVRPTAMPLVEHYKGEPVLRPRKWERFLHSQAFGRLYTWRSGATVWAMHMGEYRLGGKAFWSDDDADDPVLPPSPRLIGTTGYRSKSMRLPVPRPSGHLHMADDFAPMNRPAFESAGEPVPRSRLWLDAAGKWW